MGVVLIAVSIYVSRRDEIQMAGLDILIMGYGVVFGAMMVLIGVIGWVAAKKESRCLVGIVVLSLTQ